MAKPRTVPQTCHRTETATRFTAKPPTECVGPFGDCRRAPSWSIAAPYPLSGRWPAILRMHRPHHAFDTRGPSPMEPRWAPDANMVRARKVLQFSLTDGSTPVSMGRQSLVAAGCDVSNDVPAVPALGCSRIRAARRSTAAPASLAAYRPLNADAGRLRPQVHTAGAAGQRGRGSRTSWTSSRLPTLAVVGPGIARGQDVRPRSIRATGGGGCETAPAQDRRSRRALLSYQRGTLSNLVRPTTIESASLSRLRSRDIVPGGVRGLAPSCLYRGALGRSARDGHGEEHPRARCAGCLRPLVS
jgi:hypothetical protein